MADSIANLAKHRARGHARSIEVRRGRAPSRDDAIWRALWRGAFFGKAATNLDHVHWLEAQGIKSPNGKPWSEKAVSRIFLAHGLSAKEMRRRLDEPSASPFEPRPEWPQEVYTAWLAASATMFALNDRNGSWRSATAVEPRRTMPARLTSDRDNEGQVVRRCGPATYIVSFVDEVRLVTIESEVSAADLEVYVWNSTVEERQEASARLMERFFRADNVKSDWKG